MGFGRATHPCAARTGLLRLITKQNERCALPRSRCNFAVLHLLTTMKTMRKNFSTPLESDLGAPASKSCILSLDSRESRPKGVSSRSCLWREIGRNHSAKSDTTKDTKTEHCVGLYSILLIEISGLICNTSGFWPRVRARALRAPVFLGSLPRPTGRCAPPAHRSFASGRHGGIYFSTAWAKLRPTELRCTLVSYSAPS